MCKTVQYETLIPAESVQNFADSLVARRILGRGNPLGRPRIVCVCVCVCRLAGREQVMAADGVRLLVTVRTSGKVGLRLEGVGRCCCF